MNTSPIPSNSSTVTSQPASIGGPPNGVAARPANTSPPMASDGVRAGERRTSADDYGAAIASLQLGAVTWPAGGLAAGTAAEGGADLGAFGPAGLAIGAGAAALGETAPVSREQATAIGTAENERFAGKVSDHVFSPYSDFKADQSLPTQRELNARNGSAGIAAATASRRGA